MSFDALQPVAVTLPDGAALSYVRAGAGPSMILIHGVLGDYRSWAPQWEAFTAHFDCIALSCRFSHPNPNRMEAPDHSAVADADDVAALMDALGIARAVIVGSSYGGFAALALAVIHPGRVTAAVAVEPPMMKYAEMFADTAPVAAAFHAAAALPAREAFARGEDALGAALLTGGIRNVAMADIPSDVMERRLQNITAGRRVALSSDEFPLLDPAALGAASMPVMLMTGADTAPIFKAIMAGIARTMPQARVEVIEGVGHSVAQDKAAIFNRLTLEFLGVAC